MSELKKTKAKPKVTKPMAKPKPIPKPKAKTTAKPKAAAEPTMYKVYMRTSSGNYKVGMRYSISDVDLAKLPKESYRILK